MVEVILKIIIYGTLVSALVNVIRHVRLMNI